MNKKSVDFTNSFNYDETIKISSRLDLINTGNVSQDEMDNLIVSIEKMFKSTADRAGMAKKVPRSFNSRRNRGNPWFDNDCRKAKSSYLKAKKSYKLCKSLESERELRICSNVYKKNLKESQTGLFQLIA